MLSLRRRRSSSSSESLLVLLAGEEQGGVIQYYGLLMESPTTYDTYLGRLDSIHSAVFVCVNVPGDRIYGYKL